MSLAVQRWFMAQILIRNLDKSLVDRLKVLAKAHNRSLQGEVKFILEEAVKMDDSVQPRKPWARARCW